MILLLDADITVYQAACKNQEDYYWNKGEVDTEDISSHVADMEGAIDALNKEVTKIMKVTKCSEVIMALSSPDNFRYDVLPTYKHNRKDKADPILREGLKDYVKANYDYRQKPRLEGDDILAIFMTLPKYIGNVICATTDKDLRQVPGRHYNFGKEEFFTVTKAQGDHWFYMQTLTGDTADGYKGCPGIGAVKAEKILEDALAEGTPWANPKELQGIFWSHIVKTYESKGLTEADALQQARVARMIQSCDYNFTTKEPIMWHPSH